jgi:DNA primase
VRRFGKELFLLFDPDEAGKKAALRGLELCIEEEMFPIVVPLPEGQDPDGYFQKGGDPQALWSRGVSGVEYAMEMLMERYDLGAVEGRIKAVEAVLPFLLKIKDGVHRDPYLKRLAEKTGVREGEILNAARAMRKPPTKGGAQEPVTRILVSTEKTLVQMMLQYPELIPLLIDEGVVEGLEGPDLRSIGALVIRDFQRHGDLSLDRLAPTLEEHGVSTLAFALAFQEEKLEEEMAERVMKDCLRKLKMNALKRKREGLNKRIKEAEAQSDEALLNSLFLNMEALNAQIRKLQQEGTQGSS